MVSSGTLYLTNGDVQKFFTQPLLFPISPPDFISSNEEEFDFSDFFGPVPAKQRIEVDALRLDSDENHHNFPSIIHNRANANANSLSEISEKGSNYEDREKNNDRIEKISEVGLADFEFLKLVGRGAFGKVFQVKKKNTSEIFAMKVMRKDKILEKNHAAYMKSEKDILTRIDHPFVVKLRYSFQTKYRLYLVLDFVNGGHLFFQLHLHGLFREDLARIYAAEIISAVCHLHSIGIMHRDLKPENILLDADGHIMLTDFGLAKEFDSENPRSNSLCGTVEYMAPEIITGKGHDKAADWWSVGILLFEMLSGKPPFTGGNRVKIQQKIAKEKMKLPAYLSSEAHSLLKGLLQKEENKRLGGGPGGGDDIKRHRWFKSINWRKIDAREIQPSFQPNVSGKLCVANFNVKWTSMPLTDSPASSPVSSSNDFAHFTYARPVAEYD